MITTSKTVDRVSHWIAGVLMVGFAIYLIWAALQSGNPVTLKIIVCCIVIFALCWVSAVYVLGFWASVVFGLSAEVMGWLAEKGGEEKGLFFGVFHYTDVLGPRLFKVPVIIPPLWFALAYIGYVLANLMVRKSPGHRTSGLVEKVWMSLLTGFVVTAADLGSDPYMVYVVKGWTITNGDYFHEAVQGLVGWVLVAFAISLVFRFMAERLVPRDKWFMRWYALIPVLLYLGILLFFVLDSAPCGEAAPLVPTFDGPPFRYPCEIKSIVAFAMGIPVIVALAGFVQWVDVRNTPPPPRWTSDLLDSLNTRGRGDDLADVAAGKILERHGIAEANKLLATLGPKPWEREFPDTDVGRTLKEFWWNVPKLPRWMDAGMTQTAGRVFWDHGLLSTVSLFCGSLPACYIMTDEAEVLHRTGQLKDRAELRIRATASMIYTIMDRGGLTPGGRGYDELHKVRLMHGLMRVLLRQKGRNPLDPQSVGGALAGMGDWDPRRGAPLNQEQKAYTILSFGYEFILNWRCLGLHLTPYEESSILHAWNVAGHVLGLRPELMAHTMAEAEQLFTLLQRREGGEGRSAPGVALAKALTDLQRDSVPIGFLKPLGPMMTRLFLGKRHADMLGIRGQYGYGAALLFWLAVGSVRAFETVALFINQLFGSRYSAARIFGRLLARQFFKDWLMKQVRPITLSDDLLAHWAGDSDQPALVNWIERKMAGPLAG